MVVVNYYIYRKKKNVKQKSHIWNICNFFILLIKWVNFHWTKVRPMPFFQIKMFFSICIWPAIQCSITSSWKKKKNKKNSFINFSIHHFLIYSEIFLVFRFFLNPRMLPSWARTNHSTILLDILGLANINWIFL